MTSDWREVRLADLCEAIVDCPHSTPVWSDSGFAVLRSHNIRGGRLSLSDLSFTDHEHFKERTRRARPQADDLVITREAPMGEVCIIPADLECCLGQRMVLLRPNETVNPTFLLYALQSPRVQEQIRWNEGTGSTVSNLRIPVLEALQIPTLSLAGQRAIARVLGSLDSKIELNRNMSATLESMARAVFKAWFQSPGLRFEEKRVSELSDAGVLSVGDGYRAKNSEMAPVGLPFARAGNIDNGFDFDGADLLGELGVAAAGDKVSRPFDVVFTSKGTIGRFAFVGPTMSPFVYSPQLCFWRSTNHELLNPFVLRQWLASRYFLDQVDRVKGQTDMAEYVSLRDQRAMRLALASPAAQKEVGSQLASLQRRVWHNDRESQTLAKLRDTLLPRLLSGELSVADAEGIA